MTIDVQEQHSNVLNWNQISWTVNSIANNQLTSKKNIAATNYAGKYCQYRKCAFILLCYYWSYD